MQRKAGTAIIRVELPIVRRTRRARPKRNRKLRLETLVATGFRLSLDDFGTGYSSLSSLRSLPIATIKLDKSFLFDVPSEPDANAVTKAVIALASDLRLQVIAEGVEDQNQAQFLREIKCGSFQGYLFSKPMLPLQATEWLLANNAGAECTPFIELLN